MCASQVNFNVSTWTCRELQSRRQLRDDEEVQLQSSITHMKEHVKSLFISHRGDDDVGDTKRMMSGYGLTNST